MRATFLPYLERRQGQAAADSGAYIRVRVPDGPRPDGSVVVYLPDGTALVVDGHQLVQLDARVDSPDS
jgi:hypothetical protein